MTLQILGAHQLMTLAQPLTWMRSIQASTFTVDIRPDEVYGQGQSHSNWNTPNPTEMDLKLDLYVPENEDEQRPLVVFTHGGWVEWRRQGK